LVFDVSDRFEVEGNIVTGLSDEYDWLAERVRQTDFVKDIRISSSAISDDHLRGIDSLPDILNDAIDGKEIVRTLNLKAELLKHRQDVVLVDRTKLKPKGHGDKDIQ